MVFDSDKVQEKINKTDIKIIKLQEKIFELNVLRSKLTKILDIEVNETNEDGTFIYNEFGIPNKIKQRPKDELTDEDIDDIRREEIFNILKVKSDLLTDQS